ncbi:MAG: hypothetical protein LIP01_00300 [Tannerellaceae bacterium]|nr:hypothetical protein [Tannerellaceae bacterium]
MEFDKDVLALIRNEFLPSFIDGKVYQFPIRTAVSIKEGAENKQENIFNKINIAFTYEKESLVGNNEFEPNLKWDIKKQEETRVFIKELLIMAVNKAPAEGYELNRIKFVRFKPLSLSESLELVINGVWKKCLEEMELPDAYDLTESYTPYYYYSSQFNDASTVATIDIGGDSVDFVLFSDKHPQYASSVLFGCDVIWGAGKSDEPGDKTNGIYTRLEKLVQITSADLKKIEADMKEKKSSYTSADIINFWITNDKQTGVIEKLMQPEYRPVYITHIAAILYHIAQTMKLKNITTPLTALAFSGNGSKYISLFKTKDKLRKITEMLFKEVFGEDGHVSPKLQVVLPEDLPEKLSGKQVTAHGGLKIDFTPENIKQMNNLENYVYVGTAPGKEKQWEKKRGQELLDNPQAITDICDNVINFLNCLNKIFDEILDNKPTFEKTDSGELRTSLLSIIGNLLDKDEKLKSSLFFLPLRQEIYKMTKQLKIKD